MKEKIKVFVSYAREDLNYFDELKKHLFGLKRRNDIDLWYDGEILPGQLWNREIQKQLEQANIILFLVSPDFLSSQYIFDVEIKKALERHEKNEVIVIPIIIRPCFWQNTPLAKIQALPRNAKPINSYVNLDEAYHEVVIGIKSVIDRKNIDEERIEDIPRSLTIQKYTLFEVFVVNGTPELTFVEPQDYTFIKLALKQPGRGIVIEGPSGIGKTSTAINLLNESMIRYKYLSARISSQVEKIDKIEDHEGIVVIDDFHRLSESMQNKIANHLKFLADCGSKKTKLIVIGIPNTGDSLIKLSFDLANRITIFKIGSATDDSIKLLIEKGEIALNVDFFQKDNIIRASYGSLQIAQLLCQYIVGKEGIEETQSEIYKIKTGPYDVINRIIEDLKPKYDDTLILFTAIGGRRDRTCLNLIKELAISEDSVLHFTHLKARKPELKSGIKKLLAGNLITNFFEENPNAKKHLLFDSRIPGLVINDPQLKFYLNKCSLDNLELMTGKFSESERSKVFISYSHNDEVWIIEVLKHLKHLERKGLIDLWVDKRIKSGQNWRDEINIALSKTKVAILLLSPDFLASDFIIDNEVPPILKAVEEDDAKILQLFLRPCSINNFPELNQFQMVNSPSTPITGLNQVDQDLVLVKLAELVNEYINDD